MSSGWELHSAVICSPAPAAVRSWESSINSTVGVAATTVPFTMPSVSADSPASRTSIAETEGIVKGTVDRKSTRLNSSHQIISYAVFCLKKKNKKKKSKDYNKSIMTVT